ncbi:Gluconolactonase [Geodia barretti]|uniref:Gluconolactonase n=1 Tax=Geodia barretti TaxID=519541 RepID=A0AA35RXB7_GEOBA|nr:Gluconolactonase [Geodia barretti]
MPEYLEGIVESGQEAQQLATDFAFTEGPLWHPDGYWLFVDLRREPPVIHRMSPAGGTPDVIREPSGGTNGMTLDLQGRLLMCEGDNRRITRMESDGTINVVADRWDGKRFHRPNDIVCRSDGSIFITNPSGRVPEEDQEIEFPGTIHRIAPDGTVEMSAHDIDFPNGIAFSPDESVLYVSNTRKLGERPDQYWDGEVKQNQFVQAYDVAADGSLSNSRVFGSMASAEDGVPDGMKVDAEGRVYCTGSGGVWVFAPDGQHLGIIRVPEIPANCAFGGPDFRTMLFTARTSVYSLRMTTPGAPLPRA